MTIIYQEIGLNQAFLSKMPKNGVKLLNWLIDQMVYQPSIKISIKNIMIATGLAESTLHKWIAKFKRWGILKVEQRYGMYCHNTFTLKRSIFQYARYLKYQLESLSRYLFKIFNYKQKQSETPYIYNKDIYNNNLKIVHPVHPNLFINYKERSSTGDGGYSSAYQEFVFYGNGSYERSIPDDHQLENFIKILEKLEKESLMNAQVTKEELFWDGLTKVLKLSDHGKIKLQVFPVRIVNNAYKKLQQQNRVPHKVKWLIRECDSQCKQEGIVPAWSKYYDLMRSFNIDQNDSLIQEDDIQVDLFDFNKPKIKEVQVYSTRDLSSHKKDINPETLQKGLLFLGSFLPLEVQEDIKKYINNISVE